MSASKTTKIVYWTATLLIFLFEGVMPALTSNSELAKEGIRHLGYPDYFRNMLTVFKVLGALALVLPFVKGRLKEWAYAGLAFDMIAAFISLCVVDGVKGQSFFPLVVLGVLITSYIFYQKYSKYESSNNTTSQPANQIFSSALQ